MELVTTLDDILEYCSPIIIDTSMQSMIYNNKIVTNLEESNNFNQICRKMLRRELRNTSELINLLEHPSTVTIKEVTNEFNCYVKKIKKSYSRLLGTEEYLYFHQIINKSKYRGF